jgi:hypothetical protein
LLSAGGPHAVCLKGFYCPNTDVERLANACDRQELPAKAIKTIASMGKTPFTPGGYIDAI